MHDNVRSGLTLRDADTTGNQVLDSDFFNNYDPSEGGRAGVGLAIKFGSGEGNLVRVAAVSTTPTVGSTSGTSPIRSGWSTTGPMATA